jgi:hypothetical protein
MEVILPCKGVVVREGETVAQLDRLEATHRLRCSGAAKGIGLTLSTIVVAAIWSHNFRVKLFINNFKNQPQLAIPQSMCTDYIFVF